MLCFVIFWTLTYFAFRQWLSYRKNQKKADLPNSCTVTVGFFHPYCDAGGGGERVLWTAIRALQCRYRHVHCIVYTGDASSKEEILSKAKERFNITFQRDIEFVFLKSRIWVEARMYPYFTLLLQSLGSVILGFEALIKFVPDIYMDTMGYAFTLPLFKYVGLCRTACYVHYPTISTDMLSAVSKHKTAVNNRSFISSSPLLSSLKILYYKAFSLLYGIVGRRADVVMVNSTWTKGHIVSLWSLPARTVLVYPPCDVTEFANIPLPPAAKTHRILSIAQFRPEKDHELQIRAYHKFLTSLPVEKQESVKLVLIGSCRGEEDEMLVQKLKNMCDTLQIRKYVEFKVNLPFSELISEMKRASMALHTMWNEHFGIGIVECMSSGLIVIAHDSGGPKMDIVVDYEGQMTGLLASDVNSYAQAMESVLSMTAETQTEMRKNARKSSERFSVENFEHSFLGAVKNLIPS